MNILTMDYPSCFVGLLLLLTVSTFQSTQAKHGFIYTIPRILRHGNVSEFCLTVYDQTDQSTIVKMSLKDLEWQTAYEDVDSYMNGEQKCKNFAVPKPGMYEMLLLNGTDFLHDSISITVLDDKLITLVQTDKPMYKPGQMVKFRVMTILSDLKPKAGMIKSVHISDPNDIRVKQFLDVENKGLSSLEFQLAPQAKLGVWKIEVKVDEGDDVVITTFEVKEYVLPRFEVTITPPSFILASSETIEGKICADYTYGKPVEGFLDYKVRWGAVPYHRQSANPWAHNVVEIDGCYNFVVNATDLKNSRMWHSYGAQLRIEASVTERGSGAIVNKTSTGPSESTEALDIKIEDFTNGYFKPGLPYYGKIIVTKPDGSPAANELIELTAIIDFKNHQRYITNYTSDSEGKIVFALCEGITGNSSTIRIDADAVMYKDKSDPKNENMYAPRNSRQIKQWYSPSLSYVQIPRNDSRQKCGDKMKLKIPFTARANADIDFYYKIMARGKVVKSGKVSLTEVTSSPPTNFSPPPKMCLKWDEFTTPPPNLEDFEPVEVDEPPPIDEEEELRSEEEVEEEEEEEEEESLGDAIEQFPVPPMPDYRRGIIDMDGFQEPIIRSDVLADIVSTLELEVSIESIMSPKFTLLIYNVLPDNEVAADSMEFLVEPCFDNEVRMEFNRTKVLPGENIDIKLEASPGSVCGVGIVDKSINILGGKHQITPELVFEKLEEFSSSKYGDASISYRSDNDYCETKLRSRQAEESPERGVSYWHYTSRFVDAIEAFKESGLMVITNLKLETRPCERKTPVFYDYPVFMQRTGDTGLMPAPVPMVDPIHSNTPKSQPTVRSNFPETWLWDLQVVGETGSEIINETAPHTITNWVGNALCMDQTTGFGLSGMTSLTTFQPFFLSLHLPYAAVRGERLPIMFTVYNYLDKCLHIKLSLDMGENFEVHNGRQNQDPVCVCGGKSYTAKYYVTPTEIGSLPILAQAEIVPGLCGNSVLMDTQYIGLTDAVQRKMLVKAEGVEQQYTHTSYLCSKDGDSDSEMVILPLPDDMIKDSARGEIKVIGDIMGPALTNLDNLVRMPTGCGEQNMVGFVPNIFVLKYLKNTGLLTEEIETNAIKHMEVGYQRELTYRHRDGSYSAFGERDPDGSVWLTAFVIKSFAQAKEYIFIDENDLAISLQFIRRSQLETGCFRETGKVFSSYMMGGLATGKDKEESFTTLTAYVVIALLHANVNKTEPVIVGAMDCLQRAFDEEGSKMDPYTMSLVGYAYTLYQIDSPETHKVMGVLNEKAQKEGSLQYWAREGTKPQSTNTWFYNAAPSAEVEMTSYALLAYIVYMKDQALAQTHNIAMWLSQQRNPHGGFASTQDTVLGLNALSEFASLAFSRGGKELQVMISGEGLEESFEVSDTKRNTLLLQTAPIAILPNSLSIKTSGKGCALVQASVHYNKSPRKFVADGKPQFHLKVTPKLYQHDIDRCDRRTITISVASREAQKFSNGMSLVTVKMITSWTPIKESLKKLESKFPRLGMKRYEHNEEDGVLTFYFDEFSRHAREFSIDVEQDRELAVSSPKPAEVKVFQYYETDVSNVQSYLLKTICGTKAEIPRTVPDDRVPIDQFPAQVRIDRVRDSSFQPAMPVGASENDNCPMCIPSASIPENFKEIVCNSGAVYKAVAGRRGRKVLKLKTDLRQKRPKKKLNIFADYTVPKGCHCDLLKPPTKRVMIILSEELQGDVVKLDRTSTVLFAKKEIQKQVRKIQRKCPLPVENS